MKNFTEFKTRVMEYLSGLAAFSDTAVIPAYTEQARGFPLKNPVITVEIGGAELNPAGLGNYLGGDAAHRPQYGMDAVITLRFGISHTGAEACGRIFEAICDALFSSPVLSVQKIRRKEISFAPKTAACLLYAEAEVKAVWVAGEKEERLFENIQIIY